MDKNILKKYLTLSFSLLITITIGILIYFVFERFEDIKNNIYKFLIIIRPILYGIVIAYLLRPICNFFQKIYIKKCKKKTSLILSIITSIIILFGIIILLLVMVIPQLTTSIPNLINSLIEKGNQLLMQIQTSDNKKFITEIFHKSNIDTTTIQSNIINKTTEIVSVISNSTLQFLLVIKDILIGIVVAIYILIYKEKLIKQANLILYAIFPNRIANSIKEEIKFGDKVFNGFFVGKILDSFIIGVICYIGLTVLQMPYVSLISVIVGITNIIPFFGPFIGAIPSSIILFVESPIQCIIFIIFIIVLQQLDGNIIGPKILGNATGVSSLWVLFSILVFGGLFGLVGMVIGIPLFAVIYDIIKKITFKLLYKKNNNQLINEYYNKNNKN